MRAAISGRVTSSHVPRFRHHPLCGHSPSRNGLERRRGGYVDSWRRVALPLSKLCARDLRASARRRRYRWNGSVAGCPGRGPARTTVRLRPALPRLSRRAALPAPGATALPEALLLVSTLRSALQLRRARRTRGRADRTTRDRPPSEIWTAAGASL